MNFDIPKILNKEMIKEIISLSNLMDYAPKNKSFLSAVLKKYEQNNDLYVQDNITKTLENISEDLHKKEFTGKELKDIISSYKFNQYNYNLLKIFKHIAELSYKNQSNKEVDVLIESVDIFSILYVVKNINELSENVLTESINDIFYENDIMGDIFNSKMEDENPFMKFFRNLNIEVSTSEIIDSHKTDDMFYLT